MWMKSTAKFQTASTFQEPLGGFLQWPPRSYTCSFCTREFRSAQALGGHMNVHRRDRARLYSQPDPQPDVVLLSKRILHKTNDSSKQAARSDGDGDYVIGSKLLVGMNLNTVAMADHEGVIICKKHKKSGVLSSPPLPLFCGKPIFGFGDEDRVIGSCPKEGVDLELRLGSDPPHAAVKLEFIRTNLSA